MVHLGLKRLAIVPVLMGLGGCGPRSNEADELDLEHAATSPAPSATPDVDAGAEPSSKSEHPCSRAAGEPLGQNLALHRSYPTGSRAFPLPDNAFDGELTTDSAATKAQDGILALDLGSVRKVSRSVVRFLTSTPQRYKIQGSSDASVWTDILRVQNPSYVDERWLPVSPYRYLRFVVYQNPALDGGPGVLNPVAEIEVYESGEPPPGCNLPAYVAPLDRKFWIATSHGVDAQGAVSSPEQGFIDPLGALDGPDSWLSQRSATVGSYVAVDMGSDQKFNQLYTSANSQALQDYSVYTSHDGVNWGHPIATGSIVPTGGNSYAPISFRTQHKRHFKLEARSDSQGKLWGFWNISALYDASAEPQEAGDAVNLALNQLTRGDTGRNLALVVDGDDTTGTDATGAVAIDLGAAYALTKLQLNFGPTSDAFVYHIETSMDGAHWTAQQSVVMAEPFSHAFSSVVMANYTCRHVRFNFGPTTRDDDEKLRVNETEVY